MSGLIKREDALNALVECDAVTGFAYRQMEEAIRAIPSVNIPHSDDWENYSDKLWHTAYERGKADRPQGEWIEESYDGRIYGLYRIMFKCSTCGYVPMHRGEPIMPTSKTLRFCPNCGARMKGAADE